MLTAYKLTPDLLSLSVCMFGCFSACAIWIDRVVSANKGTFSAAALLSNKRHTQILNGPEFYRKPFDCFSFLYATTLKTLKEKKQQHIFSICLPLWGIGSYTNTKIISQTNVSFHTTDFCICVFALLFASGWGSLGNKLHLRSNATGAQWIQSSI